MVLRDVHQISSKVGMPPIWLMAALLLIPGCGDGGGGGGFGGVGAGGLGTIGGVATTAIVYVTNSGSDNVSGYAINATTGGSQPFLDRPLPMCRLLRPLQCLPMDSLRLLLTANQIL
ncbi:MAG: hypothetical protein HC801_09890 [Nitrospira sp.]|nr:hypothetical protein [Nitrospira sp.]